MDKEVWWLVKRTIIMSIVGIILVLTNHYLIPYYSLCQ